MGIRYSQWTEENGEYYFDERAAANACSFFPRYLTLFEGEWAGQPFTLMPFQELIIRQIFGWKRTSDNTRRCRVAYVWIPRKNTKSMTAAGIAILMLFGDGEPGGQIFCIAATEKQARIVFNFIGQLLSQSKPLSRLVTAFKTAIWCDSLGAKIEPLTGKAQGKHGLNASGVVGDEIHEWPSDDLYTYVHQSEGTRRQPLDFLISTAGKRDGVGWQHWKLSEAILNGEIHAPDTFVYIASADADRDSKDPNYWQTDEAIIESNPGLGQTVKLEFLRSEIQKAKTNRSKINDVKRYFLNLWVDQAVVWLDMGEWDKCGFPALPQPGAIGEGLGQIDRSKLPIVYRAANLRWMGFFEAFKGRRCYAGTDLSSTTDLTCNVFVFPPDDNFPHWAILPRFFIPEEGIDERKKRDAFDYQSAADVGAIFLTPGNVVDYEAVYNDFLKCAEQFEVVAGGIDRWNALQIAQQLEEAGINVELFGQGFASMSAPSKFLERAVLLNRIDHGGQPVLRWNARNAAIQKDGAENIKPVKDKSTGRIDGIVATVIAIGMSDDYKDTLSRYEDGQGLNDAK